MFRLNTKELETYIMDAVKPIKQYVDFKYYYFNDKIHGAEGTYVFSNEKGYHFVDSEKGQEMKHKVTDNLFEITFWTLHYLVSTAETEPLHKKSESPGDKRRCRFAQRLLLLEKVGSNYRKAEEILIDELLKRHPL